MKFAFLLAMCIVTTMAEQQKSAKYAVVLHSHGGGGGRGTAI